MFGNLGMGELMVILVIVLVLFGAKRIPEISASFGKGIREFKKNVGDVERSITEPEPRVEPRVEPRLPAGRPLVRRGAGVGPRSAFGGAARGALKVPVGTHACSRSASPGPGFTAEVGAAPPVQFPGATQCCGKTRSIRTLVDFRFIWISFTDLAYFPLDGRASPGRETARRE